MATLQPSGHSPQLVRRASSDRSSRNSSRQVAPFRSYKHGNGNILVNTWITNLKEPAPLPMGVKQEGAAPDDSLPASAEVAAPNADVGFSRDLSTRLSSDDPPNTNYDAADNATLLRKFVVHDTSSRRLQGLADAGLMLLALLPTVLLRFIRAAMGLLGITEHRWRGISMVVPLTLEDRTQLEVTVRNLVAGRLGRRPEPPRRGPVSPAQQLFLDVHAILAAATATATAFSLPYDGMAEAALQAKLASYLRGVAADESVCTQDCVKKMRKMARKTLNSLCAAAPTQPAPSAASSSSGTAAVLAALRSSPSATHMVTRPKPRAVAKAFTAACLLEQSRSQPDTLIQLVARLPDGDGDLVETMSLVPLAPGAEYLRLMSTAAGDPQQFAEQLEAAVDFGRLRPSDAKKDPAMQGLAINARVHSVGVVRYSALTAAAAAVATAAPAVDVDGAAAAALVALPGQCLALNGKMCTRGQGHYSDQMLCLGQQHGRVQVQEDMGKQEGKAHDMAPGEEDKNGKVRVTSTAMALAEAANGAAQAWAGSASMRQEEAATSWGDGDQRENGGEGSGSGGQLNGATSEMGSARTEGEGNDTEELLRDVRDATSSQPDLTEPTLSNPAGSKRTLGLVLDLAAAASKRALGFVSPTSSKKAINGTGGAMEPDAAAYEAAAAYAAARTNGNDPAAVPITASSRQQSLRAKPPSFTAASGPSTCITLYPTAALDIFRSVYACPRSGAFAVYGREPRGVGLSRLTAIYSACHAIPAVEQSALLARLGYANLEGLRAEVELRKALCVAQALPVVIASLRLMCGSTLCLRAAHRTGFFLHVQQSLLSDLHRHERGYLEDTKGALDVLADRMVVRFVEGSEKVLPLHVSGSSITVSLPANGVSAAALAEAGLNRASFCAATYGLTTLLFNQGINSLQSLGFLTWRGPAEPLQDSLNRHSLERLNEYAQRANQSGGPHLAALNRHYSPEGRRPAKDTAMFSLVRRACEEVGGGRAVNCKSGKDRTALEISKAMAEEVVAAGLFPASEASWLEGQFLRGLSYVTTSQNHGQPPAYAFNEMEIVSLPPGWRPDWRLCGKVSS